MFLHSAFIQRFFWIWLEFQYWHSVVVISSVFCICRVSLFKLCFLTLQAAFAVCFVIHFVMSVYLVVFHVFTCHFCIWFSFLYWQDVSVFDCVFCTWLLFFCICRVFLCLAWFLCLLIQKTAWQRNTSSACSCVLRVFLHLVVFCVCRLLLNLMYFYIFYRMLSFQLFQKDRGF